MFTREHRLRLSGLCTDVDVQEFVENAMSRIAASASIELRPPQSQPPGYPCSVYLTSQCVTVNWLT
jgi:hypothetical protein